MFLTTHRNRPARVALSIGLCLLLPVQPLLARGGGGGGFGGGGRGGGGGFGGGGGGFHGGGGGFSGGGGAGGYHGGGAGNFGGGGAGVNRGGGNFGGGGAGINRGGGGEANRFGGGGAGRPEIGGGAAGAGNRFGAGGAGERNIGGGGRNPFEGGGNRANVGNRTNVGDRTNIGNRTNNIGNRNINNFNNVNVGNRAGWSHNYNNYWHHGYWHNGWWGHGGWGYGWGWGAPLAWGLAGWGLGSMFYNSGYGSYSNPYYVSSPAYAGTAMDYSQPIQVAADPQSQGSQDPNAAEQPPSPEVQAALVPFDAARAAFKSGDYATALTKVDEALKKLPNDAAFHEFRGLVLFAQGKFQESAATIYAVLSAGPGWDWTTLSGMYGDIDDYTKQLRVLEDYRKQHPEAADAAFLLAYQYLSCGHTDAAVHQLEAVEKLLPNDPLAPQLLKLLKANTGDSDQPPAAGDQAPTIRPGSQATDQPVDEGPPVDKSKIVGTWKASRGSAVAIELALNSDGKFTWMVNQGGKTNLIEGTWSIEGNLLLLQQKTDGNTMMGKVTLRNGGFNFKLLQTGPDDPGLDFAK